jgi:hypothetical protein
MKAIRKAVKWAWISLATALILLFGINARDETPDPGVQAFGAMPVTARRSSTAFDTYMFIPL